MANFGLLEINNIQKLNKHYFKYQELSELYFSETTFLCGRNLDNVIGKCCSFPHAISNVVNSAIIFNVRVSRHSIDIDVVTHVNLQGKTVFTKIKQTNKKTISIFPYLLQCLQGLRVHLSDVVGFRHSIKILAHRVDVHQAVVCDFNPLEVWEKPKSKSYTVDIHTWDPTMVRLKPSEFCSD